MNRRQGCPRHWSRDDWRRDARSGGEELCFEPAGPPANACMSRQLIWSDRYDTSQEYDKDGNRTRLHKNVAGGYTADYGAAMDLSYTFNSVNFLTAISDSDDGNYSASVTCDDNGNITEIHEQEASGGNSADLYTYFTLDWANRVTDWKTKAFNFAQNDWQWTKREHSYDPISRLINSTYKQWWDQEQEPSGDSVEHIYAGSRHLQNTDDGTNFGERWHWAGSGAQHAHNSPVKSPNADTASTAAFNIANDKTPQRRTFSNPTTEDDQRNLYGQGKVMPKDSSGSGANWGTGIASDDPNGVLNPMNSRLDFDGTVAPTDLDRATDAREKARIGIFGSALAYAGSSPRVTSETIGRDINPLGRGKGLALLGGDLNLGRITPSLPINQAPAVGSGSSINNQSCGGGGCGDGISPPSGGGAGQLGGRLTECNNEFFNPSEKNYHNIFSYMDCIPIDTSLTWEQIKLIVKQIEDDWLNPEQVKPAIVEECCAEATSTPCRPIPNAWANVTCKGLGMSFSMPSPRTFCVWQCTNQSATFHCGVLLAFCAIRCWLGLLGAGLWGQVINNAKGWKEILKWVKEGLDLVLAAWQAGLGIIDALWEYYRKQGFSEEFIAFLISLVVAALEAFSGPAALVVAIAVAISCSVCCATAYNTCLEYGLQSSCVLTTGRRSSWAAANCAMCK